MKKDEKFIEFIEFFNTKNDQPKRVKTNNQTYLVTLEKVYYFLIINQKCSLATEVKKTCKKQREITGF